MNYRKGKDVKGGRRLRAGFCMVRRVELSSTGMGGRDNTGR